jgi:hypothetical protein
MGRICGPFLCCLPDNFFLVDPPGSSRTWRVLLNPTDAVPQKSGSPSRNGMTPDLKGCGDFLILFPLGCLQDDVSSLD